MTDDDKPDHPVVNIHFVPRGFWFTTAAGDIEELFRDPRLRLARVGAIVEDEDVEVQK